MSISRLFCSRKRLIDGSFEISGEEAYHALTVLRLRKGDDVRVFTEQESEFSCHIIEAKKKTLKAQIVAKLDNIVESPLKITLIQALPKAAKLEQIIVHGTELGLSRLIPVVSERSIGKAEKRDRWRRLALEAAKQSGRRIIPQIDHLIKLSKLDMNQLNVDLRLLASEPPAKGSLRNIFEKAGKITSLAIAIGPEGGFTEEENQRFCDAGFSSFTFGPRVMLVQTASLAIVSVLQFIAGDWNTP